jgi:hypothetical protein
LAMTEYQAKQKALAERTARLRAQRLARETSKTPLSGPIGRRPN